MITNEYKKKEYFKDATEIVVKGNKYPGTIIVDSSEVDKLLGHRWSITKDGYGVCTIHYESIHRIITGAKDGEVVDHMNHSTLDNRKLNLRVGTHQENLMNRKPGKDNIPVKGIYWGKAGWQVEIVRNGTKLRLGCYENLYEACLVRIRKEYEMFGLHSYDYRSVLRSMPYELLKIYLPEIYGQYNESFIGTPIFEAYFKRESDPGILAKLKRYRTTGHNKKPKN